MNNNLIFISGVTKETTNSNDEKNESTVDVVEGSVMNRDI